MSDTNRKIDNLLRQTMIGFLSTLNQDGSPNTMPLWYEWDGERILMFSGAEAAKIRRLRRDPRAALCIAEGIGVMEAWVSVEGTAEVIDDLQRTRDFACRLAERYYEPDRAKQAIESWSKADGMVLLDLTPTRIRSIWGPYVQD